MIGVTDCMDCFDSPRHPNIKCCFNCGKDSRKCNALHTCGENCSEWQKRIYTQYDRIKSMSFEEMAEFIEKDMLELEGGCIKAFHKCEYVITCGSCVKAPECIKKYLESEVSE